MKEEGGEDEFTVQDQTGEMYGDGEEEYMEVLDDAVLVSYITGPNNFVKRLCKIFSARTENVM